MVWNNLPTVPASLDTRQQLASIFRILNHFRFTDLIHTHSSARIEETADTLLINRYDLLFHEVTATNLVEIDEEGQRKHGNDHLRVNFAGCNIHSAIHKARPDVKFVIHTHTRAGAAVSAQAKGLLPISQQAMMFHDAVGYHDFEGFVLSREERTTLARDLGMNKALILRNHGLIVVGRTVAEAVNRIYNLERACEIQIAAQSGNTPLVVPAHSIQAHLGAQADAQVQLDIEQMAWEACLRLIENEGTDYRL
ncbi:class II aldolase/adducin family protein [Novacetimonas hansenii]|uniref:class II aldolase/adducin family protein n=1 Tax=Novacetimonas TaxID=2919364 RepID=UPI000789B224|nr:class II aldolase/adducin family protein [Novacetimonas hansenii]PYD74201.1 class II aldolase [Novacetimonas hansenii]QOF94095.1 class II aldolase/adducin family protein [Novacetimonas hansenii]RFP03197.1 class II aldolase [Novacetimonas hansenii]WEQ59551.1 class II aldolase/adducin family protein [Novacetimonas hansenii]CUW47151.1 Decarboxylase NovR [Novacetimonas hansenii]